jgi:transketolase
MAALMRQPVTLVYTHDSIGLGEDGPTHQPIEHLASLRLIPNLRVWRPCDVAETAVAWRDALESRTTPTVLALSRQNLPAQSRTAEQLAAIRRGGYVLHEPDTDPVALLIATGSEVALAVGAAEAMADKKIRVVSMPNVNVFEAQDVVYQGSVLPASVPAVAVEAGVTAMWYKYADKVVGIDRFGESAPADLLFKEFGFTIDNVVAAVNDVL